MQILFWQASFSKALARPPIFLAHGLVFVVMKMTASANVPRHSHANGMNQILDNCGQSNLVKVMPAQLFGLERSMSWTTTRRKSRTLSAAFLSVTDVSSGDLPTRFPSNATMGCHARSLLSPISLLWPWDPNA